MRLTFISHSLAPAGAQFSLFEIVSYCVENGDECQVIGPRKGSLAERYRELGVEVRQMRLASLFRPNNLPGKAKFALSLARSTLGVSRAIKAFQSQVVYSNTSAEISGAIAAKLLGLPHIWNVRENFDTFRFDYVLSQKRLRKLVSRYSAKVIFVSKLAQDSLFPESCPNACVVHNGVDAERFPASIPQFPSLGADRDHTYRIGCISGLTVRRGIDTLVHAAAELAQRGVRFSLDIWGKGDPDYLEKIREQIERLSLANSVHLMGYCDDAPSAYARYDVMVMPSRGESFSRPALESMAAGTPIVATRCGGPEEFIENETTGRTVAVDDPRQMADAVEWFLSDCERAKKVAVAAREVAKTQFAREKKLSEIRDIIKQAANGEFRKESAS